MRLARRSVFQTHRNSNNAYWPFRFPLSSTSSWLGYNRRRSHLAHLVDRHPPVQKPGSGRAKRSHPPKLDRDSRGSLATLGQRIEVGSTVHADEAAHWDALHSRYLTKRINHQQSDSADGACTNDAESFFSRLRRSEIGIHHCISRHLAAYAGEMAWREDNRRRSNGEQYLIAVNAALAHPVSRQWKGYWQRNTIRRLLSPHE
jgi:hypothetical protein